MFFSDHWERGGAIIYWAILRCHLKEAASLLPVRFLSFVFNFKFFTAAKTLQCICVIDNCPYDHNLNKLRLTHITGQSMFQNCVWIGIFPLPGGKVVVDKWKDVIKCVWWALELNLDILVVSIRRICPMDWFDQEMFNTWVPGISIMLCTLIKVGVVGEFDRKGHGIGLTWLSDNENLEKIITFLMTDSNATVM